MSLKSKLVVAGLPAAGVTVIAALALAGQPASAAPADLAVVRTSTGLSALENCDPVARLTGAECHDNLDDARGMDPGYGYGDDNGGTGNGNGGPTRGDGGYGGVDNHSPSPSPNTPGGPGAETPTPSAPASPRGSGGVSPDEVPLTSNGTGAGDTLPLTGGPVAWYTLAGAILIAGGFVARFLTRRPRA